MPFRHGNTYRALGWLAVACLCFGTALAQEPQDVAPTTLKSQPVSEGGQNTRKDGGGDQGQEKEPTPEKLSPSLDRIEAAIRDLIAQERAAQGQEPEDHEIRDLEAQQGMAFWAETMFWATLAAVIVTFAGIVLIWRTLHHTRRAADYTKGMLEEANETVAAIRRAERAYVTLSHNPPGLDITTHLGWATFKMEIKNYGRTPATVTNVHLQLDWFGDDNPAPERPVYQTNAPHSQVGAFLVAQAHVTNSRSLRMPGYSDGEGTGERFPIEKRNNLAFVERPGWNYDSPRPPDGGDKPKDNEPS